MKPLAVLSITLQCLLLTQNAIAGSGNATDPQYQRGSQVFKNYCSKCHGEKADGNGRMSKLYRKLHAQLPSNFTLGMYTDRTGAYLRKIITEGGEANKMSHYMPPFGQELTAENIDDLIHFIQQTPELTGYPFAPQNASGETSHH
jgi:mono/diheme cytochrome c family protein